MNLFLTTGEAIVENPAANKPFNIVILDGGTTNPGDITFEPIENLGNVTFYEDTPKEFVYERSKDADAIIINRIVVTRELLLSLPKLKYIGLFATGFNLVDTKAAHELGVTVCNVPFYCVGTVAQQAFALLLELCNHVNNLSDTIKNGNYNHSIEMSLSEYPIFELYGKTLGIVGYGNIGKTVAALGKALSMNILVYSKHEKKLEDGERQVSLEELFSKSDVISLHCALNDETRELVNERLLSLVKPTALLINTARGGLIDEKALADALNSGKIGGAGLDVLAKEPPEKDCPLFTAKNVVLTPHIGWSSRDARMRLVKCVADNLSAWLDKKPINVV